MQVMASSPPIPGFDSIGSEIADDLTSPAISISLATNGPVQASNPERGTNTAAYANNISAESGSGLFQQSSNLPAVVIHGTDRDSYLALNAGSLRDADDHSSVGPTLGTLGSQPWVALPRPFLDFAHQTLYEPIGELVHEHTKTFEEFDSPAAIRLFPSQSQSINSNRPGALPHSTVQNNTSASDSVFVQPQLRKSALKRKAEYDSTVAADPGSKKRQQASEPGGSRQRSVSFERMSAQSRQPSGDGPHDSEHAAGPRASQYRATSAAAPIHGPRPRQSGSSAAGPAGSISTPIPQPQSRAGRGTRVPESTAPSILPPEKVFPIQIGSELFRLSGASISSDAPSYFTQFFEEQLRQNEDSGGVRTLYIDRDHVTFRDIARHLQGYYTKPIDGSHFVKLFADAQFYSLPRLIDQLFESEIFIKVGERHFQIPKDIFSDPGNSPNFFSLGFAVFFSTPQEVFPGLDRRGLLRPPSIVPPSVPGRSSEIFADILHMLRGYPLHIRSEQHRAELLRDCRYFHLRGLEQKVIAHDISYNLERRKSEICLRLEDIKPSGVLFTNDDLTSDASTSGWVSYARPFVDDTSYELVLEVGAESTIVDLNDMRADFHGLAKARIASLFQVVANKMNLPTKAPLGLMMLSGGQASQPASPGHTPLSEDKVKVRIDQCTDITLDGRHYEVDWRSAEGQTMLHGPQKASSDEESDSDAMSEDEASQQPVGGSSVAALSGGAGPSLRSRLPAQTTRLAPSKKRKAPATDQELGQWVIRTGQWRLRVQPNPEDADSGGLEIVFVAVKMDGFSSERARNVKRQFLGW